MFFAHKFFLKEKASKILDFGHKIEYIFYYGAKKFSAIGRRSSEISCREKNKKMPAKYKSACSENYPFQAD